MPPPIHPPLSTLRLAALTVACVWSIIASAFAIDAYVKSRRDQHLVSALAPQGAVANLEDGDVFSSGVVILAVCLVIFIITCLYIVMLLARPMSFSSSHFITYQATILAFLAAWLFAVLVPYTFFFSTRSVTVTVSIGGQPLPQSIVDALIQTLGRQNGLSTRYRDHAYLRLVAILPWFTLLFTIIASAILYTAAPRAKMPQSNVVQDISEEKINDKAESLVTGKSP